MMTNHVNKKEAKVEMWDRHIYDDSSSLYGGDIGKEM